MPEIEFDVYCDKCGKPLDCTVRNERQVVKVFIEPCDSCLTDADSQGYRRGQDEAQTE